MISTRFNLSDWALTHRPLVLYFILALTVGGVLSFFRLGQNEDPDFTFKVMVVRTFWPGATAREVETQVTERLEKKLQETPWIDFTRSYSKPGESLIFITLKDYTPPKEVPNAWYQVRKKIGDIKFSLPQGVRGPFFNDEFGDTYGTIYAFTTDGHPFSDLRDHVENVRRELLQVPDVAKIEVLGEQVERVWIELSHRRLATLGIDPNTIFAALRAQNDLVPAGNFETQDDQVYVRVTGAFRSIDAIRDMSIQAGGRLFRLGDIATVRRGYIDPPEFRMRYEGQPAMGLALSMRKGGDIIKLGEALKKRMKELEADLPAGIDVHQVADQPTVVSRSVNEFMKTLGEAVIIVLGVSFISLGLRTGIVVALSIPLVLGITALFMAMFGIDLQRISLGALIIALGLLVDDAIIAVEMMAIKMEQGWDRLRAGSFAYTSTAPSMLTGTLVTAAGFLPVGLAKSAAGEYTFSIFAVVCISLIVSWFVAVLFIPYLGYYLLPDFAKNGHQEGFLARIVRTVLRRPKPTASAAHDAHASVYDKPGYRAFRALVTWCVTWRKTVMLATLGLFLLSGWGFGFVQQQFFPSANRPELVVDLWLANGAAIGASEAEAKRFEAILAKDDDVASYVTYVGGGSPRFYLPLDQKLINSNLAEVVVTAKSNAVRDRLAARIETILEEQFSRVRGRVSVLQNGPPVPYPVAFRVSGPDFDTLRGIAAEMAQLMRDNSHTRLVHFDWSEKSKTVRIVIDQEKARLLGVSSQSLSDAVGLLLTGSTVTQYRERDKLIDVVVRAEPGERREIDRIGDFNVPTATGRTVPLSQLATIRYELEDGLIWRRNRVPTITVQGDVNGSIQAPVVSAQLQPKMDELAKRLPPGYSIHTGGAIEESARGQGSVNAVIPVMLATVITLLMVHLQSMQRTVLVLITAPLGIIGVCLFLLVGNVPFGFVAMLGFIALSGMIMRNSIILVDQIEQDIAEGHPPWNAVIDATVRRMRPIMLTAMAAILAMIPLSRSNFWGPMATAIMGGLLVATVLTLLFLPALYAAWFRVKKPVPGDSPTPVAAAAGA